MIAVLNTLKYTVLSLLRERDIVIWVILFPLILSTLFNSMFSGLEEAGWSLDPMPVAVVNSAEGDAGRAFETMMEALSQEGNNALFTPTYAQSAQEAEHLLQTQQTIATIHVDAQGWPSLELSPGADDIGVSIERIKRTIIADVIDDFCRSRAAIEDIAHTNPEALAQSDVAGSLLNMEDHVQRVNVTHSKAVEYVRYFYALLGFAAFMASSVGLSAVGKSLPNISALGARRTVGGTSRAQTLTSAMLASWFISFASLLVAFAYIRWVLGVDFGKREIECIVGLALAALMATSFGALVGALPRIPFSAKSGILTGITCLLALFAGLYGTPSMQLADKVANSVPWLAAINPVKQVTDLFYSLYVYTDLAPYLEGLGILLATTAVFVAVAALLMRRQRYASL